MKIKNNSFDFFKTIVISLIIAFVITTFIQPTIVNGNSMYPTLKTKDYLILNKTSYHKSIPKRGDIIVFQSNLLDDSGHKKKLVKRVIGLPGDIVQIKNGLVYLNGNLLIENYLNNISENDQIKILVPNNEIFVLGDNRNDSIDSRSKDIGTIPFENIDGKIIFRFYPFNNMGFIH